MNFNARNFLCIYQAFEMRVWGQTDVESSVKGLLIEKKISKLGRSKQYSFNNDANFCRGRQIRHSERKKSPMQEKQKQIEAVKSIERYETRKISFES